MMRGFMGAVLLRWCGSRVACKPIVFDVISISDCHPVDLLVADVHARSIALCSY